MPRSGKLPIGLLNLLTSQKSGFFCTTGVTRCTDSGQIWHGRRAPGSAWLCNILTQLADGVGWEIGNAAPKYKKIPLFGFW